MYSIYIMKNKINEKFYIGQSNNVERRIAVHFGQLNSGRHHNIYLQRSFDKYGKEAFEYFILYDNLTKEEVDVLEEKLIKEYYDSDKLYNISKLAGGGDLISYHPNREDIVEKIRNSQIERWKNATPEAMELASKKTSGKNNGMYGKTHTIEARKKMSIALQGKVMSDDFRRKCSERNLKLYSNPEYRELAKNNMLKRYEDIEERRKTGNKSLEISKKKREQGVYNSYKYTKHDEEYEFVFNGKYYRGIESCVIDTGYSEKVIKKKLLSEKPLDTMSYLIFDPIDDLMMSGGALKGSIHSEETKNKIRESNLKNLKSNYFIEFSNGEKLRFDYLFELKNHLIDLGMSGTTINNLYKSGVAWIPKKYIHKHLKGLKIYKIE